MRAVLGNRKATVGALILLLIVFVAAFPGLIAPDDPQATIYAPNLGRRRPHLLGTTQIGQDVFSQLIWSTRQTLVVTLVVSAIATFISMIIGVTAAYVGGVTDRVLTVITDVFLILPVLPLLILLAAYLPPGVTSLIIVLMHHQLGVPGPAAALAGPVDPQPRLPRRGPGARGAARSTSSWSRSCRR